MALDIKTRVNEEVRNFVKSRLPGREVYCNYLSDSSKMPRCNRYIQVQTAFPSLERIHYEYINSHWEFHIEPPSESDGYRYGRISRYLREHIHDIPSLKWQNDGSRDMAVYQEEVCNDEQLKEILMKIYQIFDQHLVECTQIFKPVNLDKPYHQKEAEFKKLDISSEVCLKTLSMKEVFDLKLVIPDYQRIYCWEEKNITALWNNLMEMPADQDYHLGSIILQNMKNGYHIIDGQQRLVTLTLCLRALGYEGNMPLLAQRFESKEACENIANAKYVISHRVKYDLTANSLLLKKILSHLSFSVLILNSQNLDLAYTFFSNQNSRGVRLSDYDILKAHHLRFLISNDQQAEHLARRWNAVSQEDAPTIDIIPVRKKEKTNAINLTEKEDSIITFPEFLLLVLDLTENCDGRDSFYQKDKLLNTFKGHRIKDMKRFYHNLLFYRLLLDYYVVRKDISNGQSRFSINFRDTDAAKREYREQMRQYMSMLTVSTEFHIWLKPYMQYLHGLTDDWKITSQEIIAKLKETDNAYRIQKGYHPSDLRELRYPNISRYWFWRLDYYLWERRKDLFNKEDQRVVETYVFRTNRSIEHLHPQDESYNDTWNEDITNGFGNLAMISQSFNSQQSNDNVRVKFARIQEQIDNKSLQSIKLLKMFRMAEDDHTKWNEGLAEEHLDDMCKILNDSFHQKE